MSSFAFIQRKRCAHSNHLVDLVPELDLDLLALAGDPHVRPAQLAQQVQGRLGFLSQSQTQGVFLTALAHRGIHVVRDAVEAVRRARTLDPLVWSLVVVVGDPVRQTLGRVGKRRELRIGQKLRPQRLPEALDLAQGHGIVPSP